MNLRQLFRTSAPRSVLLIRFVVGVVFLSEGIQKFLYSASSVTRVLGKEREAREQLKPIEPRMDTDQAVCDPS